MEDQRRDTLVSIFVSAQTLTQAAAVALGDVTASSTRQLLGTLAAQGEMSVQAAATALRIAPPVIAHSAQMLEQQGLLTRRTELADHHTHLALTEMGLASVEEWLARVGDALCPGISHLSEEDWDTLERAAALLGSIDAAGLATGPEPPAPRGLRAI